MEYILLLVDTLFYGAIAFYIVRHFLGNKPLGKALSVIAAVVVGLIFIEWAMNSFVAMPFWLVAGIFLAPIVILILRVFLNYVFGEKNKAD